MSHICHTKVVSELEHLETVLHTFADERSVVAVIENLLVFGEQSMWCLVSTIYGWRQTRREEREVVQSAKCKSISKVFFFTDTTNSAKS